MAGGSWRGEASAPWPVLFALALAAGAIVFGVWAAAVGGALWAVPVALLISAAAALPFRRVTVTVDSGGITARCASPFPVPIRLDRSEIEAVEVIDDVRPRRWGGWGYRGSRLLFGRAAILIRRGPGISLTTRKGKTLVITVDEPEGAAAALEP